MNINTSQLLALILAIGVIMLYIFGVERDYSFVTKDVNEYDKLMIRNEKSNRIKKSIILVYVISCPPYAHLNALNDEIDLNIKLH